MIIMFVIFATCLHTFTLQMGLYLFKSLPFEAWLPSDPDLVILRQWLLNSSFGSHTHLLAQLILGNINWTRSQNVS